MKILLKIFFYFFCNINNLVTKLMGCTVNLSVKLVQYMKKFLRNLNPCLDSSTTLHVTPSMNNTCVTMVR